MKEINSIANHNHNKIRVKSKTSAMFSHFKTPLEITIYTASAKSIHYVRFQCHQASRQNINSSETLWGKVRFFKYATLIIDHTLLLLTVKHSQ